MRPDEQGADEYVLTPDQEDRSVALGVARDLLLVKSGKYAERDLDPDWLIDLARWILKGDEREVSLTFDGHMLTVEQQGRALADAAIKAARA